MNELLANAAHEAAVLLERLAQEQPENAEAIKLIEQMLRDAVKFNQEKVR